MKRSSSKYQGLALGKNKGTNEPGFKCDESQLAIYNSIELLGATISKSTSEKYVRRKVSQEIAV